MKDTTIRICMLKMLGCALAALLIGGCEGPLSAPKQDAPAGRAIIMIGETAARSLVPTTTPDFSKYELVLSADGKAPITRTLTADEDRTAITGGGYAVELDEAEWTVDVTAFVLGTGDTYLAAAQGNSALTISPATPNPSVAITLDPLAMDGASAGFFNWNLDLSGVTGSPSVSGTINSVDSVPDPSFTWSGSWTQTGTNQYTSNPIGHSATTWETLIITAPASYNITVTLTASSELHYDYGYASSSGPGGSYQLQVSGAQSQTYTYTVPPGTSYLYFGYGKDSSESYGNDNVTVRVTGSVAAGTLPLSGAAGSLELPSGYYDLTLTVTKDNGKSAGIYQTVHIYPGLTTTAEGEDFTFTDADFAEQKGLAGTVTITGVPEGKTVEWVKVRPYRDAAFSNPLAEEASATQDGDWLFTIPADIADVWFKVTMKLTGSAAEYDAPGASETGVPGNGKKDIALSPTYRATVTFDTGGGNTIDPVTVDAGSTVNKPDDPARTGYQFDNWYDAETGGEAVSWPITVTENTAVYAGWLLFGQGSIKVTFSGLPRDDTTDLEGAPAGTLSWTTGTLEINVPETNFPGAAWQWYLDNAPLSGETSSGLNKPGSDFTPGRHEVTVEILMTDGKIYSKTLRFTVGQ
jgi:uncharacterized repeat protein (TIGR02543 family)